MLKKYKLFLILTLTLILIILLFLYTRLLKKEEFANQYDIPKKIWIYWNTDEKPKLIEQIFNNNKKILSDWEINLLSDNSLNNYIDVNINNDKYKNLGPTHKSDLIRLKILEKFGGVYMDASIIINSKLEFENLFNESIKNKVELTAFTLYENDNTNKYHQYIGSWFLIAPSNSKLIKLWLIEFENAIDMGFENYNKYVVNDLKLNINYKIYNIDYNNTYLTVYTALQKILQTHTNFNILLKKSEDTMYKLLIECNHNSNCISNKFNLENKQNIKSIPYIKLRGDDRNNIKNLDEIFS